MMSNPKKIVLPKAESGQSLSSGIEIEYIKSRDVLYVSGFYDGGYGGIQGTEISITDFCSKLGVDLTKKRKIPPLPPAKHVSPFGPEVNYYGSYEND